MVLNYGLAIVGGGPAGIAAAIHASRLGLTTALVEKNELGGQANIAPWIENYPGFPDGIRGKDLISNFKDQLAKWKVKVISAEAVSLNLDENVFVLKTSAGNILALNIIVATGMSPKTIGIKNEIPYADPAKTPHDGKDVLIIGSGDCAFDLAAEFALSAKSVTICMRGEKASAIARVTERAKKRGVRIIKNSDPTKIPYDIFISCIGKNSEVPFVQNIIKNFAGLTISPAEAKAPKGLFFAGDICRGRLRHIAIAAGDGIAAAQSAYERLKKDENNK